MSKIFDAYKKRVGESVDIPRELSRVGTIALYPPPADKQQADFSRLANRILGLRLGNRGTVISFAATAAGEGSSFVSYHAALALATAYGQKVAWIDANFLSPHDKLKAQGFSTFSTLLQDPELTDHLVIDSNPFLIGGGSNLMSVKGLLADRKYGELIGHLARRFDFVILDLPPVLSSTDTSLMAAASDGLLLVIEQKFLKWEIVEHGVQALREKGVQVIGSVINRRTYSLPKVIYDRL